jgi:MurNAc alpha-1-phosphate uridylyltransferase
LPHADSPGAARALTFAGIGIYRAEVLGDWRGIIGDTPGAQVTPPRFSIVPLLRAAIARGDVGWRHHAGTWTDIGTPERLAGLNADLPS